MAQIQAVPPSTDNNDESGIRREWLASMEEQLAKMKEALMEVPSTKWFAFMDEQWNKIKESIMEDHAVPPSTNNNEKTDIRKWFASMDERWNKAQALRAEELRDLAKSGNPYDRDGDEETQAEKEIRELIHEAFLRFNGIVRGERDVEAALEFYFRFVMPDPHLAAPYLDLVGDIFQALPRTTDRGDNDRLSGPLRRAIHQSHTTEEEVQNLGAAIRQDFTNAVRAGDLEYVVALLTRLDDVNDPSWRLMASCDPAFRKWILFDGPIGPHSLRPGNEVFRARTRVVPFWAGVNQHLTEEERAF